jgi:hypothetical protein
MDAPEGIVLLPLTQTVRVAGALRAAGTPRLCIADCYVESVETWEAQPWGWRTGIDGRTLLNVDHHAADPRFYRHISSGNLAIDYVRQCGSFDGAVLINHTDCDSVVAAAILRGLLPPGEILGEAVIAADHTGEANAIADLLQALDPLRDFASSLLNLLLLLDGQPVEGEAAGLVAKRLADRDRAHEVVAQGRFRSIGRVAVASLPAGEKLPGELLLQALPDAWIIVVGSPIAPSLWENKIRLGLAAPAGINLLNIGLDAIEPKFGGRWNAGSTKRSGGSSQDPTMLANAIAAALEARAFTKPE